MPIPLREQTHTYRDFEELVFGVFITDFVNIGVFPAVINHIFQRDNSASLRPVRGR